MYFVYFLRSESDPDKTYIGQTENLVKRLEQHNTGQSTYTRRHMPWKVEAFVLADSRAIAEEAELYFKSPSGKEKFRNFEEANPEHPNPIEGFFASQNAGRIFGRRRFKVKSSDMAVLSSCGDGA